jgi:hypothetical protein
MKPGLPKLGAKYLYSTMRTITNRAHLVFTMDLACNNKSIVGKEKNFRAREESLAAYKIALKVNWMCASIDPCNIIFLWTSALFHNHRGTFVCCYCQCQKSLILLCGSNKRDFNYVEPIEKL